MGYKNVSKVNPKIVLGNGETIEGIFCGTRVVTQDGKKDFNVHLIEVAGVVHDLVGCGSLDYQFGEVKEGEKVMIKYNGKKDAVIDGAKYRINDYTVAVWQD